MRSLRSLHRRPAVVVLKSSALTAALSLIACTPIAPNSPEREPITESAELEGSMAPFARTMPGAWEVIYESGERVTTTWSSGPGGRSIRLFTTGNAASGGPWREFEVVYVDPVSGTLRTLGLGCFAHHVAEGAMHIDQNVWTSDVTLYQTNAKRTLRLVRTFDGPDSFQSRLSEETSPGRYEVLTEWRHTRIPEPPLDGAAGPSEAIRSTARLPASLVALADRGWIVARSDESRSGTQLDAAFAWIPYADVVDLRFSRSEDDGSEDRLVDVVVHRHTGRGTLRAMAWTARGGVFEGDVTIAPDGALESTLDGADDRGPSRYRIRVDFDAQGNGRGRVWQGDAAEPLYDVRIDAARGAGPAAADLTQGESRPVRRASGQADSSR
jgi:hypothetical protein